MQSETSAPFIVITLRRTGGTSLMNFMSTISRYKTVQHEPFNVDRVWGSIVSDFTRGKDEEALNAAIATVLADTPNIKHCFEIIPIEVTRALIESCAKLGYRFFVLTRRNEVNRLMSLMLARATGVWGSDSVDSTYPKIISGEIVVPPLSVDDAVRQARKDASRLGEVLKLLRHRNIRYDWLIFEEIYRGKRPLEEHAREIAWRLGIDIEDDDARLQGLKAGSGQNSSQIEAMVQSADAVRRRLEQLCLS